MSQITVPNVEGGQEVGSLTEQSQVVRCGRVFVVTRKDSDFSNTYSFRCDSLDIYDIKARGHVTFAGYGTRVVTQRAGIVTEEKTHTVLGEI